MYVFATGYERFCDKLCTFLRQVMYVFATGYERFGDRLCTFFFFIHLIRLITSSQSTFGLYM